MIVVVLQGKVDGSRAHISLFPIGVYLIAPTVGLQMLIADVQPWLDEDDILHKAVRYTVMLLVIFIVCISIFSLYFSSLTRAVNEQLIEEYAKTYFQEYKDLVKFYGNGLGNLSLFKFSEHYTVLCVISRVHGAAIFFEASSNWSFETKTNPERIEFYVWEIMQKYSNDGFWQIKYPQGKVLEAYIISANLQIGDGVTPTYFYVGEKTAATFTNDYTITVMPLARLRIDGTLKYENEMILKGSNDERDWLPKAAIIDATNEFLRIAKDLAIAEAGLRKIEGMDVLREKADEIEKNKATGVYEGNEALQSMHEQEFWEEVDEYGIHPEVAQGIINMVKERYTTQPWYSPLAEVLPQLIIDAILVTVIASPLVFFLNRWYERKFPLKKVRRPRKHTRRKKKKR